MKNYLINNKEECQKRKNFRILCKLGAGVADVTIDNLLTENHQFVDRKT